MNNVISGSFSQFDPEEVIERIDVHLKRIEIIREDKKKSWFEETRAEGKKVGFPFFKKRVDYTEEELNRFWENGDENWHGSSPEYEFWTIWDTTIKKFQRIRDFCQLATDAGNRTVNLSKEDALFAYNWK